jgi:hypothetical protein
MSDLITRLHRRAHLPEFKICGEAADALEAAEQERDVANRRYEQLRKERRWDLQEGCAATAGISSRALMDA